MNRKVLMVLFAVTGMLLLGAAAFAADEPAPQEPKYMGMNLKLLDGGEIVFKDLLAKNEKTLLVFFQTACSACRGELAYLSDSLQKPKNLQIVGVSVDVRPELVKKYRDDNKLPFLFLSDADYAIPATFDVSATPASVLLDKGGKVIEKFMGYNPAVRARMEAQLK